MFRVALAFIVTFEANNYIFSPITQAETLTQHFYIYVSLIFGMLAGYLIEYHKRQNFLGIQKVSEQAAQLTKDKSSLMKLSKAVEQSDQAILIADKDGTTEYINPAFTTITGYEASDIIGKTSNILQDSQGFGMWDILKQGQVWSGTIDALRKDGTAYPALVSVMPIKNKHGEITHYVSTKRDMTEYKHLENQLRQAQKMEAIGTLVGGIAHDFNNTLTGITGNVFLAKAEVSDMPSTLEKLDVIETLAFQASDMVKQLLAFSRKGIINLKPMSITAFLQDVSKLHKVTLPSQVTFTQDLMNAHNLTVRGDANQLQQVIINLLNNARDAVAQELHPTINLTLDTWKSNPEFKTHHPHITGNHFVRITISDNGHGIKKEITNYIFEPFYTTKDIDEGTGLGLSMAYGTAQSHGGTITVKSEWNEGASFTLYLPLIKDEVIEEEKPAQHIPMGHDEVILLVDDQEAVLATGYDILESLGYKVLTASDGLQAIDVYNQHKNDIKLVILDIAMPNMDGFEAAKRLREMNHSVAIIFVTGFDSSHKLNIKGIASEDVILKPYKIHAFSQKIQAKLNETLSSKHDKGKDI